VEIQKVTRDAASTGLFMHERRDRAFQSVVGKSEWSSARAQSVSVWEIWEMPEMVNGDLVSVRREAQQQHNGQGQQSAFH
jgi:hypothetical protein